MTKEEYRNKRKSLVDKAQALIDKADYDGYEAVEQEIKDLDNTYEKSAKAQADLNALRGSAPVKMEDAIRTVQDGVGIVAASIGGVKNIEDPYDTDEYKRAFMDFACRRAPIPEQYRMKNENQSTSTSDVGAVIPTTTMREIIRKLESYGSVYNSVRHLNVQGGVEFPILDFTPKATWIADNAVSETQKVTANNKVSFSYHGLECRISQSILVSVVTYAEFQQLFVPMAVEAIIKALEIGIFNGSGSGQMLGVTKDTRVTNVITIKSTDFTKWGGWKKNVFAKIPLSYRKGNFYFAAGTWDGYIDGMTDDVGQPIGRTNYGIESGAGRYRFGGINCQLVEDEVIKPYDLASANDVVGVFMDPVNYAINSNMRMTVTHWIDNDDNTVKDKVLLFADGKALDTNGIILIKKGA
ncbi:MAG TPA: phage major capsid protein [Candidatus Onthovicinus excrementipullorum]|nr:phage major capsid protein [Candidatus Onthovicinus excrementipullorum]